MRHLVGEVSLRRSVDEEESNHWKESAS